MEEIEALVMIMELIQRNVILMIQIKLDGEMVDVMRVVNQLIILK
jgi:hypothetical protein